SDFFRVVAYLRGPITDQGECTSDVRRRTTASFAQIQLEQSCEVVSDLLELFQPSSLLIRGLSLNVQCLQHAFNNITRKVDGAEAPGGPDPPVGAVTPLRSTRTGVAPIQSPRAQPSSSPTFWPAIRTYTSSSPGASCSRRPRWPGVVAVRCLTGWSAIRRRFARWGCLYSARGVDPTTHAAGAWSWRTTCRSRSTAWRSPPATSSSATPTGS